MSATSSTMEISPLMRSLNEEGLQRARVKMQKKFAEISSLDDISSVRAETLKKLTAVDTQLKGAVQSKLDSLKRAVDLMEESTAKLGTFTSNIDRIDKRIHHTDTTISNFDNLKRVHYARDNLSKVIAQVKFFSCIPEQVAEYKEILDSDPTQLKDIYLKSLRLESWRGALMRELQASRVKQQSVANPPVARKTVSGMPRNRIQSQPEAYSSETYSRILSVVGTYLETVLDLSREVRQRLWDNIERLFDIAAESPADLVTTFEIIEMHNEYASRRMVQANAHAVATGETFDMSEWGCDNIKSQAMERLQQKLLQRVEGSFLMAQEQLAAANEQHDGNSSKVQPTLMAATQLLQVMTVFKNEVLPCIPPDYDAMNIFLDAFENQLKPSIEDLVVDVSALDVSDCMQLIDWLEYYVCQVSVFVNEDSSEQVDRECCRRFLHIAQELMHEYLFRIKSQVMEWFGNIKKQPLEVGKSSSGLLMTSIPEDMFNVIHMQIAVAKDKLAREHLKDVINACLQVLREVQRQSHDGIAATWKDMDIEQLCATINDTQRMQEKCQEFADEVVVLVVVDDDRNLLLEMLDEVSSEYISLAVRVVNYLARSIMRDLDEPVFSQLFTPDWESGAAIAAAIPATIADYSRDIEVWLPQYFFSKFLKECCQHVVLQYVMTIRRVSNFTFSSELTAARRIIEDFETFQEYFMSIKDTLKRGGLEQSVENELQPITMLARILSATHISGAEQDVMGLCMKYGVDGLKLVQSAIMCVPSMDKTEKSENLEAAVTIFEKLGLSGSSNIPESLMHDILPGMDVNPGIKSASKSKTPNKKSKWGSGKKNK